MHFMYVGMYVFNCITCMINSNGMHYVGNARMNIGAHILLYIVNVFVHAYAIDR